MTEILTELKFWLVEPACPVCQRNGLHGRLVCTHRGPHYEDEEHVYHQWLYECNQCGLQQGLDEELPYLLVEYEVATPERPTGRVRLPLPEGWDDALHKSRFFSA